VAGQLRELAIFTSPLWMDGLGGTSDGHNQIMSEFCSISSLLDHLDHRPLSITS